MVYSNSDWFYLRITKWNINYLNYEETDQGKPKVMKSIFHVFMVLALASSVSPGTIENKNR